MKIPPDLELMADGKRLVSLTFTVTLFTNELYSKVPEAVLACYKAFLGLCPAENLKFYLTENMKVEKPVTKRALNMLETWLKPGAPPRPYYALELKDGELGWAPKFKFEIWGAEIKPGFTVPPNDANLVSMSFPPEWGWERTADMLQFVRELCDLFPYRSGYAGFSFECSRYDKLQSQKHAWAKSMRHRGIDIFNFSNESLAVQRDGIKGIGWLTILDNGFVKEFGGQKKLREALPDAVELLPVKNGLIIKAGPQPQIGDTNRREFLPEYKAVYKVVKPLAERAIERSPNLLLGPDSKDKTRAWLRRFDDV
jgi:hypothetical protein